MSKLYGVFLAAVVKTKDIKTHGSNKCFEPLNNELVELETKDLEITLKDGKTIFVHFILGLVLSDNLGLNTALNFSKSFSCKSFCRLCKEVKGVTQNQCIENAATLRTTANYSEDLDMKDVSKTGVSDWSIFNVIPSFHVVDNFYVDVMHDIFEGVCHYDLCHIITYFVEKMRFFDLQTLNLRKNTFNYGQDEIGNISGEIKTQHLTSKHLKMTAREVMTFIHFLTLMIGDLVPDDDEVWQFILNLIELTDMILLFEIDQETINLLKHKIENHNKNDIRVFNDTLKPKFHNLIHYPTAILKSGPSRAIWCFKYEAKHK